jgi:DNA-binding transcriptional ArsR family regulator
VTTVPAHPASRLAPAGPAGTSRLRIHVSLDDLARTRVAAGPNVLWEIVLSLRCLQRRAAWPGQPAWRREAARTAAEWAGVLLPLVPPTGPVAGFLVPPDGTAGLADGLAAVQGTQPNRIGADLAVLASHRLLPAWTRRLADGDRGTMDRLVEALRCYFEGVLAPLWPQLTAHVDADRAGRARALLDGGYEGLLASFHPLLRWHAPVLEVDTPATHDLHPGGRGLLLVPSAFGGTVPFVPPGDGPPVLVYPIRPELGLRLTAEPGTPRADSLAALLGHTRAAVLLAVHTGCTTTELARRAGISSPSASQHATVLRAAGLIRTQRHGGSVRHSLTPLGASLVDPGPAEVPAAPRPSAKVS